MSDSDSQISRLYFDREMSWLEFNKRVLEEAQKDSNPILERLRFLTIFANNLDEFFMVRIAGLLRIDREEIFEKDRTIYEGIYKKLQKISDKTKDLLAIQRLCYLDIMDLLEAHGVYIQKYNDFDEAGQERLNKIFDEQIMPVLTPLSYDPSHPFPFLTNLSLYLVIVAQKDKEKTGSKRQDPTLCFLEIPKILPRLFHISEPGENNFIFIEDLIEQNLDKLFPGLKASEVGMIRVTRNLDYSLFESEVVDLMKAMKQELITREQQDIVRLEMDTGISESTLEIIRNQNTILDNTIFISERPLQMQDLASFYELPLPKLKYDSFNPRLPKIFKKDENIFSAIRRRDILVHHPFDSFNVVVELLKSAATDPDVLAIKQTLYRTGGSSPIIEALVEAARNGKHVTAVVELKARFDEKNNMTWAKELQKEGINVVFGFVELKTHAKATLIVRREKGLMERYVHLSTGNYNHQTSKVYTDIGFFSCDPKIGQDVSTMFNLITGINVIKKSQGKQMASQLKAVTLAPLNLRERILKLIQSEIDAANAGKKAEIVAKMNALVDYEVINKLYDASQAGVRIRLLVRGMCCLVPGVKGISDNIEVRAILGRFLEHSRIFYFWADGKEKIYLSSADWMPRNFDRRLEIMWPITSPSLKKFLHQNILEIFWQDNTNTRILLPTGEYQPVPQKGSPFSSQQHFISEARQKGIKLNQLDAQENLIKKIAKRKN